MRLGEPEFAVELDGETVGDERGRHPMRSRRVVGPARGLGDVVEGDGAAAHGVDQAAAALAAGTGESRLLVGEGGRVGAAVPAAVTGDWALAALRCLPKADRGAEV